MTEQHDEDAPQPERRRRFSPLRGLRGSFLTGMVVIAPIGLTVWLIWTIIGWVDGFVLPLVPQKYHPQNYIGIDIHGVGVIFFLIFTLIVGWLAKGIIGRSLLGWGESLVDRMPVVRSIYNALKQIAETVFSQAESSFEETCLVEYPRRGVWAVGFITTATKGEIERRIPRDEAIISVFLPTTPNPTSGFLLFVPRSDVIVLNMTVEEAAKMVISAGLVHPEDRGTLPVPIPGEGPHKPTRKRADH